MRRMKKKGVIAKKNIPLSQFPPLGRQGPAMDADLKQNLKDLRTWNLRMILENTETWPSTWQNVRIIAFFFFFFY